MISKCYILIGVLTSSIGPDKKKIEPKIVITVNSETFREGLIFMKLHICEVCENKILEK